jgi:hypothetical protein
MPNRWNTGPWQIIVSHGAVIDFKGDLRVQRDAEGHPIDYDTRGDDDVLVLPSMSEVVCIRRIAEVVE